MSDGAGPRRWVTIKPGGTSEVESAWLEAARLLGGDFEPFGSEFSLRAETRGGTITLRFEFGELPRQELRAPFANPRGLNFHVRPQRDPSLLERFTGGQVDVTIGRRAFDEAFQVITDSPVQTQEVLSNPQLQNLFLGIPDVDLSVADGPSVPAYPEGVDEIVSIGRPMLDHWDVVRLFELVETLLLQIEELSSLSESVRGHIRRLSGPGGTIRNRTAVWEGDIRRRAAADALGEARDARGVRALMDALQDPDSILRAKAIRALAKIGDPRAVSALVPLLGKLAEGSTRPLADEAAEALRSFGLDGLVDSFEAALAGDAKPIRGQGQYSEGLSQALIHALEGPDRAVHGQIFKVLADLGAVEALPAIRERQKRIELSGLAAACSEAIERLVSISMLPRPTGGHEATTEQLPRPADGGSVRGGRLPRPSDAGE